MRVYFPEKRAADLYLARWLEQVPPPREIHHLKFLSHDYTQSDDYIPCIPIDAVLDLSCSGATAETICALEFCLALSRICFDLSSRRHRRSRFKNIKLWSQLHCCQSRASEDRVCRDDGVRKVFVKRRGQTRHQLQRPNMALIPYVNFRKLQGISELDAVAEWNGAQLLNP
jgi:hypothetical protein